jgi:NADH-quinone oxidoreductase subunit L
MLTATLAIAGIPPVAGFFSKDEILSSAFASGHAAIWVMGLAGAALTAFYMFRLYLLTFRGRSRLTHEAEHHLHESPWTMTMPLQVLGVLSIVGGFLGFPGQLFGRPELNRIEQFLEPVILPIGHSSHGAEHAAAHVPLSIEFGLIVLSLAVAGFGIWLASRFYSGAQANERPRRLAERFPLAYKLLLNKYWVDELYDATVIKGSVKLSELLWEADARVVDGAVNGTRHVTVGWSFLSGIFDLRVVDGAVNLIARAYDVASVAFRRLQVGFTQGYAMVMVFGAAILLVVFLVSF